LKQGYLEGIFPLVCAGGNLTRHPLGVCGDSQGAHFSLRIAPCGTEAQTEGDKAAGTRRWKLRDKPLSWSCPQKATLSGPLFSVHPFPIQNAARFLQVCTFRAAGSSVCCKL